MKLFEYLKKLEKPFVLKDFPKVVVDQTNYRIGDVIRRNLAGEQVLGDSHMSYDFHADDPNASSKVNPFNDVGFDLDDVIRIAKENGKTVDELQNRLGELKADLDKSKSVESDKSDSTPLAPVDAPQK